jgi:ribosomal protein L11 methylase PrmA
LFGQKLTFHARKNACVGKRFLQVPSDRDKIRTSAKSSLSLSIGSAFGSRVPYS